MNAERGQAPDVPPLDDLRERLRALLAPHLTTGDDDEIVAEVAYLREVARGGGRLIAQSPTSIGFRNGNLIVVTRFRRW